MAGGLTKGKSHAKGGIKMKVKSTGQNIEVEGGEGIINKHTMSSKDKHTFEGKEMTACEIASDLNQKTGNGVSFDCDETDNTDMTPTDQSTGFAKGGKPKRKYKKKKMAKSKKKTGAYAKLVSKIMKRDGIPYREAQKKAKDEYVSGATSQKKKPKKTYKGRVDNLKSKSATKISYSGRPKMAKGGEIIRLQRSGNQDSFDLTRRSADQSVEIIKQTANDFAALKGLNEKQVAIMNSEFNSLIENGSEDYGGDENLYVEDAKDLFNKHIGLYGKDHLATFYVKDYYAKGGEVASAIFNPNSKKGKISTSFGDKNKDGLTAMIENDSYSAKEIANAIFEFNEKRDKVKTNYGDKTKEGLIAMIESARDSYAKGGYIDVEVPKGNFRIYRSYGLDDKQKHAKRDYYRSDDFNSMYYIEDGNLYEEVVDENGNLRSKSFRPSKTTLKYGTYAKGGITNEVVYLLKDYGYKGKRGDKIKVSSVDRGLNVVIGSPSDKSKMRDFQKNKLFEYEIEDTSSLPVIMSEGGELMDADTQVDYAKGGYVRVDNDKAKPHKIVEYKNGIYISKDYIPYDYDVSTIVFFVSDDKGNEYGQFPTLKLAKEKFNKALKGEAKDYAKGGDVKTFEVGGIVRISEDNDNENYDDFRGKDLRIVSVAYDTSDHFGYDESMDGMALYDLEVADTGEDVPFSLYEYEVETYAKGGELMDADTQVDYAKGGKLNTKSQIKKVFGKSVTDISRDDDDNAWIVQGDLDRIKSISKEKGINTERVENWGIRIFPNYAKGGKTTGGGLKEEDNSESNLRKELKSGKITQNQFSLRSKARELGVPTYSHLFEMKIPFAKGGKIDWESNSPKIYVASLSDYNAGRLEGEWIDFDDYNDGYEVMNAIQDMLMELNEKYDDGEEREEWAIHDHEYTYGIIGEYSGEKDFEKVYALKEAVEESGLPFEVLTKRIQDTGQEVDEVGDDYNGAYDSEEDFADQFKDETGMSAESASYYVYCDEVTARVVAGEQADNGVYGGNYDDDDILEMAGMEDEYEEADDDDKEDVLDKAKEELYNEIYDEWNRGLRDDAVYFLVSEQGIYSEEDVVNLNWLSFDLEKWTRDLMMDFSSYYNEEDGMYYIFNN